MDVTTRTRVAILAAGLAVALVTSCSGQREPVGGPGAGAGPAGQCRNAAQAQGGARQGSPVLLCSGRLGAGSGAVSTVTRQYELLGGMYAEWLARRLGGQGKVAMLSGLAGVPTAEYQRAAAKKVFAKYPG